MVDFAGWDMPVNYGSQIEEHHAVRRDAGMFDVSHMLALDLAGPDATAFPARPARQRRGQAQANRARRSTPACSTSDGGVIDDLIVYYASAIRLPHRRQCRHRRQGRRLDAEAHRRHRRNVTLTVGRDLAMIAVQGPRAIERAKTWAAIPELSTATAAPPFQAQRVRRPASSPAPATPARTVSRSPCPRAARSDVERPRRRRCKALRPRRARHPAPRSRHESLRQRHGRNRVAPDAGLPGRST
jgi:glycine cleavage system aminomethyltransferase T